MKKLKFAFNKHASAQADYPYVVQVNAQAIHILFRTLAGIQAISPQIVAVGITADALNRRILHEQF